MDNSTSSEIEYRVKIEIESQQCSLQFIKNQKNKLDGGFGDWVSFYFCIDTSRK